MFSHLTINELTIPKEITSIGEGAFYYCNKLVSVTMKHNEPPTLGDDAFDDCYYLKYIYVPQNALSAFKSDDSWKEYNKNESVIVAASN